MKWMRRRMDGWKGKGREKGERYQRTCSVVIVLCLVAGPQVADQSPHSLRLQFTVGQLHLISRASDSGVWGHVWGSPLQSGLNTSTAVSSLSENYNKIDENMTKWVTT